MGLFLPPWSIAALVSGAVGLLSALYLRWKRYRKVLEERKPFDGLPMPPNSHWLLGQFPYVGGDFRISQMRLNRDFCNEYGQTGYWLIKAKVLSVTSAEDARAVLNNSNYRKSIPIFRRHMIEFLGPKNILYLSGKEWRFHRSSIVRAFTPAALNETQPRILKAMSTLITSLQQLGGDQPVERDIGALMKMITIDIFGQTALSRDLGCCQNLKPSPIAVAFDYMGEELSRRLFSPS